MRIFISYGHDCTEFVQRLRADLEALGHDVWMDVSRIHRGSDWRSEIADGIVQCQASLIFLSAHSLRPGSVCLDEIFISVACNRRIIRPVLMEKGIEDQIPPILMEKQFFDFSDWKENLQNDAWYKAVTASLWEEIDNIANSPYERQMEMLRVALRPNIPRNRFMRELEKPYCERKWLDELIKGWLDHSGSELLVVGFPGSGKSNYFTHYCQFSPNVVSLILCEWNRSREYNVGQTIRNISFQIASTITAFRNRLIWILNSGTISLQSLTEEELFDVLITEPFLYEIDGNREPLLIILDGVDEMTSIGDNALARLIADKAAGLPRFVHFVLSSRKDSAVLRYHSGAHLIELTPSDRNVREDIRHYLNDQLGSVTGNDCAPLPIAQIAEMCEGSFLLASLIASGIRQGGIRVDDAEIPSDVHSIYFEWMSRLVTEDEFAENYYDVFAILASLDKPVTVTLLREALNWNARKLNEFVRRFRSFLTEEKDIYNDKCLTLYHNSFRNWLIDEDGTADIYMVSIEDGYELISRGALALWEKNKLPNGEVPYLRAYLVLADLPDELDRLEQSDTYLRALIEIARDASENRQQFVHAEVVLQKCEDICKKRKESEYVKHVRDVTIPLLRVGSYYDAGDFIYVRNMLSLHLPGILSSGSPMDVMQSLYMLGMSCDLLGERTKSVEYLKQLKQVAEQEHNTFYRNRALVGLAWNSHFSNISSMNEMLANLEHALEGDEDREKTLLYLVTARALNTRGDLARALEFFSSALETAESYIWGFGHLAIRSQMLLIESLVACYDNEKFDLGIKYGQDIYSHLSGTGSIAECYCASWLANNCLANGMIEQADMYLQCAESLNNESNGSSNSAWMNMHLTSIRGLLLEETGEYKAAFGNHEKVAQMAIDCADSWVLGDALFEMIILSVFRGLDGREDVEKLVKELDTTAERSGLPHLRFKCDLIKAFLRPHTEKEELKEISDVIMKNSLAATDMVVCSHICRLTALRENYEDLANALEEFIRKEIRNISEKNPEGAYSSRRRIKYIQESLQN